MKKRVSVEGKRKEKKSEYSQRGKPGRIREICVEMPGEKG